MVQTNFPSRYRACRDEHTVQPGYGDGNRGAGDGTYLKPARDKLSLDDLLAICVGDTLDADRGRAAFRNPGFDLVAAPHGEEMFQLAHAALVQMAKHVPGFAGVAKQAHKFCHGYGIFQYDLQFFKKDPTYFLEQRWRADASPKCLEELRAAMGRMGIKGQQTLTEFLLVHVAIAYNAGSFKPAKGLQQGHFDGKKFYGEMIFDFLRLSQTVSIPAVPAPIPAPAPGTAPVAPPTPVTATGPMFEVDVKELPLRLRSAPQIDPTHPTANVIARLPDGHRVRLFPGETERRVSEVETSSTARTCAGLLPRNFSCR